MKKNRKIFAFLIMSILMLTSMPIANAGSQPTPTPVVPVTTETFAEFADDFAVEQMSQHNIPGMLVAAVLGDEIIFSKGYGYADLATEKPMDPATSVFRAASLSKLFVAGALMQLAEQGLIDLDADINEYLVDLQIPATFPQHISVAHLLTHTAGFDDLSLATRFDDPSLISSLGEDVSNSLPPRVRPPGEVISYSNYGYALAGYIVESVTGMLFEDYIEQYLFTPLSMEQSTFQEPPPPQLAEQLITMYTISGEEHVELPRLYNNLRPGASIYTTIEDLARFAKSQVNRGRFQGETILSEESIALMQNTQFAHHPELEGWGYGYVEFNRNGLRIIGHGGDFNGARTMLYVIPEVNFAMVVHYNSNTNVAYEHEPRSVVIESFVDRFFPAYSLSRTADEGAWATPVNLAGYYHTTRYTQTTPAKYLMPNMIAQMQVTQDERGHLFTNMFMSMVEPAEWVPYGEGLFVRADRETFLSYQLDDRGKPEFLFFNMGGAGAVALERAPWYGIYWVIFAFLAFSVLIFLLFLLSSVVGLAMRLVRRRQMNEVPLNLRRARTLALGISVFGLLSAAAIGVMVVNVMVTHNSPLLALLPVISLGGWLTVLASIALFVLCWRLWKSKEGGVANKILLTFASVAGLTFTWFLYFGNMLSFMTL